mmetsp:Transcript_93339/g.182984  ORF Transcript_93339/g.182984 Transcript_93339/m.182984 type:complete len:240 (-) Transcript_93339:187-906(-)
MLRGGDEAMAVDFAHVGPCKLAAEVRILPGQALEAPAGQGRAHDFDVWPQQDVAALAPELFRDRPPEGGRDRGIEARGDGDEVGELRALADRRGGVAVVALRAVVPRQPHRARRRALRAWHEQVAGVAHAAGGAVEHGDLLLARELLDDLLGAALGDLPLPAHIVRHVLPALSGVDHARALVVAVVLVLASLVLAAVGARVDRRALLAHRLPPHAVSTLGARVFRILAALAVCAILAGL